MKYRASIALLMVVGCPSPEPSTTTDPTAETLPSDPTNDPSNDSDEPPPGSETAPCVDGECLGDLVCLSDVCVDPGALPTTSSPTGDPTGDPGTGPGTDTGGTTSAPPDTEGPCMTLLLDREPGAVVLVIDRSGSMDVADFDHDNSGGTPPIAAWASVVQYINQVVPNFDGGLRIGAATFPSAAAITDYSAEACVNEAGLDVAPDFATAQTIAGILPPGDADLDGGGPLAERTQAALDALTGIGPATPRSIVILADGPAQCRAGAQTPQELFEEYDEAIHTVILDAIAAGVTTHVIGIQIPDETSPVEQDGIPDQTNPHEKFNLMATQGGRPREGDTKYWAVEDDAGLQAALEGTLADAGGCNLALGVTPVDPTLTQVNVGGENYGYQDPIDCESTDGWVYVDDANTAIRLCGAACESLKAGGSAQVSVDCV